MPRFHSSCSSEIGLCNLRVPEKEIEEDESVVMNSSYTTTTTTTNKNRLGKNNADLNNGSDAIFDRVVTRRLCYLLISILFAILILIVSGAFIFDSFHFRHHQKLSDTLQVKLLTPRTIMPTFCDKKTEGLYSPNATNLKYYNIVNDLGDQEVKCALDRILGGEHAEISEFPHQVYFASSNVKCGGSILNQDFILTAAHCFFTNNGTWRKSSCHWSVVGGDTYLNETEGTEQIRNISIIYTHPGFRTGSPLDDIALVKLSRPFKFNKFVKSALLPKTQNFSLKFNDNSALYVSGYGDVSYEGVRLTNLQKAKLPIVTTSECQGAYDSEGIEITEKMICAGAGGRDSCQGDSGGPLSFKRCDSSGYDSVLVGVVSGGIECGHEKYPGVYTKVSKYLDWIQTSIKNASI